MTVTLTYLSVVFMCLQTQASMLRLERKHHMCWCVCDYEGMLKQFFNPSHTHAKSKINSFKIQKSKDPDKPIPLKRARRSRSFFLHFSLHNPLPAVSARPQ